jgi:hypothetical protein
MPPSSAWTLPGSRILTTSVILFALPSTFSRAKLVWWTTNPDHGVVIPLISAHFNAPSNWPLPVMGASVMPRRDPGKSGLLALRVVSGVDTTACPGSTWRPDHPGTEQLQGEDEGYLFPRTGNRCRIRRPGSTSRRRNDLGQGARLPDGDVTLERSVNSIAKARTSRTSFGSRLVLGSSSSEDGQANSHVAPDALYPRRTA